MKKILILGASGGIGRAISKKFLEDTDYQLLLQYHQHPNKIEELKQEYRGRINSYQADLSSEKSTKAFIDEIDKTYHTLDYMVFSNGVSIIKTINQMTAEEITKLLNINLTHPILITRRLIGKMIEKKAGSIVYISSMWGITGSSCESVYSASKGGLIAFSKALSKELGPSNIRVNSISPGFIDTPMNNNIKQEDREAFLSEIPMQKSGSPQDIANAVYFLLSDQASYITGANLKVDGGYL